MDKKTKKWLRYSLASKVLTGRPTGYLIDHINRNTLDNRLENLRFVDPKTSCANRNPKKKRVSNPNLLRNLGIVS